MAIWQFRFHIIHRSNRTISTLEEDDYDKAISWIGHHINEESVERLKNMLSIEKSWCDEIIQYGNKDKTNLQFFYEGEDLIEILCNIDLRSIEKEIFDEIVDFIKANNAMFFYNNDFYDISKSDLVKLIISSDAYNFCENPIEFLQNIESEII